ncbi:uncharacterized protein CBL_04833 [Carabus blaptoides fortunei]
MLDKQLSGHKHRDHGPMFIDHIAGMSSETDDVNNDPIQGLLNDTDSELSSLSHLDDPNENVYMICGVLIAMILVGVIIILLATIISKLRKREENSNSVHPAEVVLQTAANPPPPAPVAAVQQTAIQQLSQPLPPDPLAYRGQFLWQFPPPPPQFNLYGNDQETLVQNLPAERPGFCRGFRKNLGGRWRRLVKRKPTTEVYTIPAELKPQLKQIYVY